MRLPRYRPPANIPDVKSPGFARWMLDQLRQIGDDFAGSAISDVDSAIRNERLDLPAGATRRVAPTTSGVTVTLEAPGSENAGDTSVLIIENPRGPVVVTASPHTGADGKVTPSLINGQRRATFTRSGVVVFYSNGVDQWKTHAETPAETSASEDDDTLGAALAAEVLLGAAHPSFPSGRVATDSAEVDAVLTTAGLISWAINAASLALTKLATQAANTVLVNATAGAASPTAVAVSQDSLLARIGANLVSHAFSTLAGRHLTYEGAGVIGLAYELEFNDLVDRFIGGNLTSGSIGELGWSTTTTGTTALTRLTGVSKHPGIVRLSSGGAATGRLSIHFGPASASGIFLNALDYCDFLIRTSSLVAGATNTRSITFGFGSDIDAAFLGTDSVGFIAFPGTDVGLGAASNNWTCFSRSGGGGALQTTTTSGVTATATTDWKHFRIKRNLIGTASYIFYIDDMVTPVATITTNFPTIAQNMGIRQANGDSNAGAHTLDWDEYMFRTDSQGARIP